MLLFFQRCQEREWLASKALPFVNLNIYGDGKEASQNGTMAYLLLDLAAPGLITNPQKMFRGKIVDDAENNQ